MLASENSDEDVVGVGLSNGGTSLSVVRDLNVVDGTGVSTIVVDGVNKTVRRRVRKRNVPTRDFAQSP